MELDGYILRNRHGWTNDDIPLDSPAPSTIMPDTTNSDLMAQSPLPTPCNTVTSREEAGTFSFTPPRSTLSTRSPRSVRSPLFARSPVSARSPLSARSPTLATSPRSVRSLLSPRATARSPRRTRSPSLHLWSPSPSSPRAVLQPINHMENVATAGEADKAGSVQKPAGNDLAASLWQDKRWDLACYQTCCAAW